MQSRTINKKDHLLFDDVNEFEQFMPNTELVENWRDGFEGDWILCDDGKVCQVFTHSAEGCMHKKMYASRKPLAFSYAWNVV